MYKIILFVSIILPSIKVFAQNKIDLKSLKYIGKVDVRYQSYNIEMCEVIGGDFWIPYNLIDSVKKTTNKTGFAALKWKIDPINLYEKKLRNLAKGLGPTYVRVSGTWANAVYFQNNDEPKLINPPKGFNNVLTRQQWKGVVDFCIAVDGKLVTSFPISDGMRDENGKWQAKQVQSILEYTKSIGGEIAAAEFFNEPSHSKHGDAPKGYTGNDFAQEFDMFKNYVSVTAPNMKILGPGSTGEGGIIPSQDILVDQILSAKPKPIFDVFTYHYYGTVSKRCGGGQNSEKAMSAEWLSKTEKGLDYYQKARDKYMPNVQIWNTETAETACGGNPMAATYIDTFRYLEQLGRLAKKGVQVVMHNTLSRSEYGLIEEKTLNPRPNYWAALLWNKLMGNQVFEYESLEPGIDVFVHSLKNKLKGKTVMILNTYKKATSVVIPSNANQYLLTADDILSKKVRLNGTELNLNSNDELPSIKGKFVNKGTVELPAQSIIFLTFNN